MAANPLINQPNLCSALMLLVCDFLLLLFVLGNLAAYMHEIDYPDHAAHDMF